MTNSWKITRLGDLATIKHGWPFKSDRFSDERAGRPIVVSVGNFDYSGGFRFDSTAVKEYLGEYPADYNLHAGDVLLVMTCQTQGGEILGIPASVPNDGYQYLHNQRLGKVVLKTSEVSIRYLYWLFLTPAFNRELVNTASGTKILHTAPSRIEAFEFPLPPLHEQVAIASLLDTLDEKIKLNRRMSATLEAISRTLFKSWFVDFDPVRAKAEGRDPGLPAEIAALFPDSFSAASVKSIPSGWETLGLDEVASFLNGLALQNFPPEDGAPTLPIIKIAQLRAGHSSGADRASSNLPSEYVIGNGDILFSWSGSLECKIWTGGPGALNQHLFKVRGTEIPNWFAYLAVHEHLPEFRHIAAGKATTMGHIQRHHLHDAKIAVPSQLLTEAATSIIGPIIEASWTRRLECSTLAAIRDALLPKLISGELRVADAERVREKSA